MMKWGCSLVCCSAPTAAMCRTVTGTLLVAAADITVLLAVLVLIPLLVHHMTAVGAEQHTGEQPHFIIAVRAFALLA